MCDARFDAVENRRFIGKLLGALVGHSSCWDTGADDPVIFPQTALLNLFAFRAERFGRIMHLDALVDRSARESVATRLCEVYGTPAWAEFVTSLSPDETRYAETIALVSALFAFGSRSAILPFLARLFGKLEIYGFLRTESPEQFLRRLPDEFRYRWLDSASIRAVLLGIRKFYEAGTATMHTYMVQQGADADPARACSMLFDRISDFAMAYCDRTNVKAERRLAFAFASASKGGGSKRMCLFLSWMIRGETPNIGLWNEFPKTELPYPLDTHLLELTDMLFRLHCTPDNAVSIKTKNEWESLLERSLFTELFTAIRKKIFSAGLRRGKTLPVSNTSGKKTSIRLQRKTDFSRWTKKIPGEKPVFSNTIRDAMAVTSFYSLYSPEDPLLFDFPLSIVRASIRRNSKPNRA